MPFVGSSKTNTLGLDINALAIKTRCCWPPDNSAMFLLIKCAIFNFLALVQLSYYLLY